MNLKNDFSANAEAICNQCVDARKKADQFHPFFDGKKPKANLIN